LRGKPWAARQLSLASIFSALRMLELFLVLPVFALERHAIQAVTKVNAMGIYGLTQCCRSF
jgi:hypothetical protein